MSRHKLIKDILSFETIDIDAIFDVDDLDDALNQIELDPSDYVSPPSPELIRELVKGNERYVNFHIDDINSENYLQFSRHVDHFALRIQELKTKDSQFLLTYYNKLYAEDQDESRKRRLEWDKTAFFNYDKARIDLRDWIRQPY